MAGAAAGAGGVMTSLGTAISKTGGAQARADEAQIEFSNINEIKKRSTKLSIAFDVACEAKEQMKQAMKVLNDMSDLQSQVVGRLPAKVS